jgi:response regulator RpfG family c-di-GMP phosphodiesterase
LFMLHNGTDITCTPMAHPITTSTILIVDDNPTGRIALEALLLREGYHLEAAESGPEALEKVVQLQPDLMLLDVMMPDMDGFEVCQHVRANPDLAELPILMVTALNDDESRMQGIEAGADDFISKPYSAAELRARVRTITRLNRYRRLAHEREQRQQAEEQTRAQLQRLSALHHIDMQITASLDLDTMLHSLVEQLHSKLQLDAAAIWLFQPHAGTIEYASSYGFRTDMIQQPFTSVAADTLNGYAILNRRTVYIADLNQITDAAGKPLPELNSNGMPNDLSPMLESSHTLATMRAESFASFYGVPLFFGGQPKGLLQLFHRTPIDPGTDWLNFLETLASQASIAISNAELFAYLAQSYDATLQGWVGALDLRDKETEGHSLRVTEMTVHLARQMGLHEDELVHIRRGALLHDIGKLGIPDSILLKPGKLTEEEWAIMKTHPTLAYQWLSPITYLHPALDIPYCHHEKWDGSGYPRGLQGEQIPLAARIFAVIDVWDALSSDRPYRKRWPKEQVYAHVQANAGTHFDPAVVQAFLQMQEMPTNHSWLQSATHNVAP